MVDLVAFVVGAILVVIVAAFEVWKRRSRAIPPMNVEDLSSLLIGRALVFGSARFGDVYVTRSDTARGVVYVSYRGVTTSFGEPMSVVDAYRRIKLLLTPEVPRG